MMSEMKLLEASRGEDGIWRDKQGEALHVSASDLERHAYCPLSWQLARQGISGKGDAISKGVDEHALIHEQMTNYEHARVSVSRELTIWGWWFGIVLALSIDGIAWYLIADQMSPQILARYLALLAAVWVGAMILSTILPWRKWLDWPTPAEAAVKRNGIENDDLSIMLESPEFIGGWIAGGKVEAAFGLGAILLILHAAALWTVEETTHAGFILLSAAMLWTLLASWRLQRVLIAGNNMEDARSQAGVDKETKIAYSDDAKGADLLVDEKTGIRGRPDQIVIVDGEFIPMEQKTGRIPKSPHLSHKVQLLAYIHLVNVVTGHSPSFGVLRYGEDDIHKIDWSEENEKLLNSQLEEIQRLMVEGGAKRNHERAGKCKNCSRKRACPEALA